MPSRSVATREMVTVHRSRERKDARAAKGWLGQGTGHRAIGVRSTPVLGGDDEAAPCLGRRPLDDVKREDGSEASQDKRRRTLAHAFATVPEGQSKSRRLHRSSRSNLVEAKANAVELRE